MDSEKEQDPGHPYVAPEHVAAFAELRRQFLDEVKERAREERDKADTVFAVSQQRIGFFEKLTVLDGGTFALSLTLLSALSNHIHHPIPPGLNLGWLYAAWSLLLLSIVMCWVHNNFLHAHASAVHSLALSNLTAARHTIQQDLTNRFSALMSGTVQMEGKAVNVRDALVQMAKAIGEGRLEHDKLQSDLFPKARRFEVTSRKFAAAAVWSTWIAFLLILIFAMRTGYILLLPG